MNNQELYKFGDFALCADENLLQRNGETVPLTPKMFELLLVLVRNHGKVVEKNTLLKEVWPDSFVEEGNIAFNIRQLRKALDDDAQSPTYIETVPRRGYRFIAEVVKAKEREPDLKPSESLPQRFSGEPPVEFRKPFHPFFAVFVVFVALLGAGLAYLALTRPTVPLPIMSTPFSSEKLSMTGTVFGAAVSPDGKTVVYSIRSGNKHSVWLRQLDTGTNLPFLPGVEEFYFGFTFSPDGEDLFFSRARSDIGQPDIYRVPIRGGIPEKLISNTAGPHTISPNGERIAFVRCPRQGEEWCSLWMADAKDGANASKLLAYPEPNRISDAVISPDGRKIALAVGQSRNAANEFRLIEFDVASRAERPLSSEQFFNIKNMTWLPDQSGVLITASRIPNKYFRIWHVSADTGSAEPLTKDSEAYSILSIDKAGKNLISTHIKQDFQLYRFDLAGTQNKVHLAAGVRPAIAPDGKVYFSSIMSGNDEIWSMDRDGNDQRQLTNDLAGEGNPLVSPDNRSIFFASNRSGETQIWKMNMDGSGQVQITKGGGGGPAFISSDGNTVFYQHAFHGNLWSASLDSGEERIVLDQSWRRMGFSPDGSMVAMVDDRSPERALEVVSLKGNGAPSRFALLPGRPRTLDIAWMPDGRSILYLLADSDYSKGAVFRQQLNASAPELLLDLKDEEVSEIAGIAVMPDGRSLVVVLGGWRHDAVLLKGLK
ncbi:MAG TPA: winged helix-turn-helix domain-containing protein [Pyrinomonadaceae bacterium]|nr:winged helix-turn-helix domain-containing protein [Pyrinomonadaceae bacterium]